MDVKARAVVRVIIAGEWIWVEPGTFNVLDFVFVDDEGRPLNQSHEPAYHFISTNGDPYFGPLSALQLIKLRPPELDSALAGEVAEEDGSQELPAAEKPTDPEPAEGKRKISADELFKDPVPMPAAEGSEQRRGGLL